MNQPRTILAAIELPASAAALGPVADLARAAGWNIRVVHVAAPDPVFVGFDETGGAYDIDRREDHLEREAGELAALGAELAATGLDVETELLKGPTIETLIADAEAHHAAMIVLTDHRHRLMHRVVFGSVASGLLKASPIPVLVLPPVTDEPADTGLPTAVTRLIDVIDTQEPTPELSSLRVDAEAALGGSAPSSAEAEDEDEDGLINRLRDTVHHFETDHPSLVRALNDVSYYLSGSGL